MKKFRFPLARLVEIRRRGLEAAQLRLHLVRSRRESLVAEAARLEAESREVGVSMLSRAVLTGSDLAASDAYRLALDTRRGQAIASARQLDADERSALRQAVEARRKVKLLDLLEARRRREHQRAADREQEAVASEIFLSGFQRRAVRAPQQPLRLAPPAPRRVRDRRPLLPGASAAALPEGPV